MERLGLEEASRRRVRIDASLIDARFLKAQGLVHQLPWPQAAAEEVLEDGRPVRAFPVRAGRRIAPGWWWSVSAYGLGSPVAYG